MSSPHPVEILIPMATFSILGFLFFGPIGGGVGGVIGAAMGSVANISIEDEGNER